jgi:hypothetical protein
MQDYADVINLWLPPNDVSKNVEDIATAMSNVLRSTRNSQTSAFEVVPGTASTREILVQIRWVWMAMPATLLMFSLSFLAATLLRSRGDDETLHIYKTSALPVLFYNLGEECRPGIREQLGQYRSRAKRMDVML